MFTAVGHALKWLSTTRHVIKSFAKEVRAVADASTTADTEVEEPVSDTEATALPASLEEGIPTVHAVAVHPMPMSRAQAAQAKVQHSFDKAWRMTQATNEIFALSLSFLFVMTIAGGVSMWIQVITEGKTHMILMASLVPCFGIAILVWVSTAGDAFVYAQASLLRPNIALGLHKALGRDEHVVFARSLKETQLGFELVNVVVTTNRVLYVVFSLMVLAVYVMPKA